MDAIDNIIFATLQSPLQPQVNAGASLPILSNFIPNDQFGGFVPGSAIPSGYSNTVYSFSLANKQVYCSYPDYSVIETSIMRHWYDINGNGFPGSPAQNFKYTWPTIPTPVSDFTYSSNYHLIYAYLLENSRILQIFEKVIDKYLHNEELGIAPPNVYQWFLNSERLFFGEGSTRSTNIRSLLRISYDANRRNAYYRLFGIDLAFGDISTNTGGIFPYEKSKTANQQFIPLFERYLSEVWQAYINARNTSGPNTADINNLVELATQLRELLIARRGIKAPAGTTNAYAATNLSMEEFASVVLVSWFTFIICDNTEVVTFLNCQSSTIGERLIKIGDKVGVAAHTKSQALFEMAGAAAFVLNLLEAGGYLDSSGNVQNMITSLDPGNALTLDSDNMNYFLLVIHNWEKATGHTIKNPEAKLNATVKVQPTMPKVPASSN
jgi:hypothetical protein